MDYTLTRNGCPILTASLARCKAIARALPGYTVEPATAPRSEARAIARAHAERAVLRATEYETLAGGF